MEKPKELMEKYVKNKKRVNTTNDSLNTMSEAEAAYGLSVWFGAIFYYLVNWGKLPFHEMYQKKYRARNVWTGWFLQIVFVAIAIYGVWKLMDYLYP